MDTGRQRWKRWCQSFFRKSRMIPLMASRSAIGPSWALSISIGKNLLDDRGAVVARVADEANDMAWQHWRKHDRVFGVWRDSPAAGEEQ